MLPEPYPLPCACAYRPVQHPQFKLSSYTCVVDVYHAIYLGQSFNISNERVQNWLKPILLNEFALDACYQLNSSLGSTKFRSYVPNHVIEYPRNNMYVCAHIPKGESNASGEICKDSNLICVHHSEHPVDCTLPVHQSGWWVELLGGYCYTVGEIYRGIHHKSHLEGYHFLSEALIPAKSYAWCENVSWSWNTCNVD